jgi:hypothetical protein
VAYIAGALGIKTYLFLPENGNWPWEIRKLNNNFFTSVKVIQQAKGQSWASLAKSFIKTHKHDFRRKIK